jgi:hypothetical protein
MNVLLYAPTLLLLLLKAMNIIGVVSALAGAALVQVSCIIQRIIVLIMQEVPFSWSMNGYTDTRGTAVSDNISGFIHSKRL